MTGTTRNNSRKGIPNKFTGEVRKMLQKFVEEKFNEVIDDFDDLEPKDRVKMYIEFLSYVVPKMQSVSGDIKLSQPIQIIIDKDDDKL